MEVANFTLSDKQLYANIDKLLQGPNAILPPPLQNYWGGGCWPLLATCSYAYVESRCNQAKRHSSTLWYESLRGEQALAASTPWLKFGEV